MKFVYLCLFIALAPLACPSEAIEPGRLWIYTPVNFQVDADVDRFIELMRRGHEAGYNGVVVTDFKFGNLSHRPDNYNANMKRARQQAESSGMELIPCVMPVGYSNSILQNDPNLAAGLPVTDCPFQVNGRQASIVSDSLLEGSFEKEGNAKPVGWDWIDGWASSTSLDSATFRSGQASLRMHNFQSGQTDGNCRVVRSLAVTPHRQYRLILWTKSEALDADLIQFYATADGKRLSYQDAKVLENSDWTRHDIVFNSMEANEVSIYLGVWSGKSGTLWIDDVSLNEVGGINLLRRPGCPIQVADAITGSVYEEGCDYVRWVDSKLGQVPYAGEFSEDHESPSITIAPQSRIRDGQSLKVSFYHTVIVHQDQVCCALAEEKLFELFRDQVRAIQKIWKPKTYFLQHDEIRVAGYDALAGDRTAGRLLADNVRRCIELIRAESPASELVFWSDMFDPNHNAVDDYYLTNQTMKDSWLGLNSTAIIANWNHGNSAKSLRWFDDRSHPQIIAGYYDSPVVQNVLDWKRATSGVAGIRGWLYTTWTNNYDDLEIFARTVAAE